MAKQKAFLFDVNTCTGCEACLVACALENRVDPAAGWRCIYTLNPRRLPGIPTYHYSIACAHCVDAPCKKYCPALAYSKDPDTGAVILDPDKCLGCKYCSWVCPYGAPRFSRDTGIIEKCTFCLHRLESGLEPACVALCPTGALGFGDYETQTAKNDGGQDIPGLPHVDARPALRLVTGRERKGAPLCTAAAGRAGTDQDVRPQSGRVRAGKTAWRAILSNEWMLVVFTLIESVLAGAFVSRLVGSTTPVFHGRMQFDTLVFLILGVVGMVLSTFHLGRQRRMWRAVLNARSSWLSREILLFMLFLVAGTAAFRGADSHGAFAWCVAAAGFAALFATDRVYDVTRIAGVSWHSARVLLTGLLFAGLFSANAVLFGLAVVVKTLLYLRRKYRFAKQGTESRPWVTRVRVLTGSVVPLAVWYTGSAGLYPLMVAGVMIGEFVDRCEFYIETIESR